LNLPESPAKDNGWIEAGIASCLVLRAIVELVIGMFGPLVGREMQKQVNT
jgi:hypothetical protein